MFGPFDRTPPRFAWFLSWNLWRLWQRDCLRTVARADQQGWILICCSCRPKLVWKTLTVALAITGCMSQVVKVARLVIGSRTLSRHNQKEDHLIATGPKFRLEVTAGKCKEKQRNAKPDTQQSGWQNQPRKQNKLRKHKTHKHNKEKTHTNKQKKKAEKQNRKTKKANTHTKKKKTESGWMSRILVPRTREIWAFASLVGTLQRQRRRWPHGTRCCPSPCPHRTSHGNVDSISINQPV